MTINKITALEEGNPLNSTGADLATSVNQVIDSLEKKIAVVGDNRNASLAENALSVDGQIKLERTETVADDDTRPVWIDMNYYVNPEASPTINSAYHGIDIFSDVHPDARDMNMANISILPLESKAQYSGRGLLKANYGSFFEASNDSSGTIVTNVGMRAWARNSGTGTITNNYGIRIDEQTNSGTIRYAYGLYINDVNPTLLKKDSYAIYTKLGQVRFGDDLLVMGAVKNAPNTVTGVDLDAVDETMSTSFSGDNFTGAPTTGFYYVRNTVHSELFIEQWLTGMTGAESDKIYRRVKDNGVWKAFKEVALV